MKLKILHIAKFYAPYSGGMETIIKDLCEGMTEKGHDVRVLCTNIDNTYQTDLINNVEIFRYPLLAKIASQTISPSLIYAIRKQSKWADVVHIHSPNPLCEIASLFIPKNIKIISTHHSDIYRQKSLKRLYRPIWNLFTNRLSKILVPTKNHLIYSDMINNRESKVEVIPFGIREENYLETERCSEIKNKFGKYLLFVGRLVEYKGLKFLIEAVKDLDINLVIIGNGPDKESLNKLINSDKKLSTQVSLLGRIESQRETNAFFKNAYSFILPSISKNENFGIVQLEAMIHSLPIITTNLKSGVPLVGIPNKTTLLVPPKDSLALKAKITTLINNPNLATKMGKKGQSLFQEKYTFSNMINLHERLYINLCNVKEISEDRPVSTIAS